MHASHDFACNAKNNINDNSKTKYNFILKFKQVYSKMADLRKYNHIPLLALSTLKAKIILML